MEKSNSQYNLPPVIFGTSGLGNLFTALPQEAKCAIVEQCVEHSATPVVFDSAGKYGAGLALESLGKCLKQLGVAPEDVLISNKLGWLRVPLTTPEPTFEPGVWKDLEFDAVQKISYDGILECFEQGNELLGDYQPQMVSVHDPDEYLDAAASEGERQQRYQDVLEAYRALADLKAQGKVAAIGVGAKKWPIIQQISKDVELDWVMIANSMTIKNHPDDLLDFMEELAAKGVTIINSAVFHAGFLTGGNFYDYKEMDRNNAAHQSVFNWRDEFNAICEAFGVKPAEACVKFGLNAPGVKAIALNTTNAKRVKDNVDMANAAIPADFWQQLFNKGLISERALGLILK